MHVVRSAVGVLLALGSAVLVAPAVDAGPGPVSLGAPDALALDPALRAPMASLGGASADPHFVAVTPGSGVRAAALEATPGAWAGDAGPAAGDEVLPPVVITPPPSTAVPWTSSPATGSLHERVGPNRQPVWTTQRRFPTTRAYVIAPWQVEVESWWEGKFKKDGTERHRFLEELEIGLPGRVQLDLYWRLQSETGETTRSSDVQVEARWALAPWNALPLNPTLYGEYKFLEGDEPEAWEAKLLLAADVGCRWQWAFNLFYERQMGGDDEIEMGFAQGLSYALLDPCLTLGVEMKLESTTAKASRDDPEVELLLGPSLQWHPTPRFHLDVAPLFGLTEDSPDVQVWIVAGFDLLPGSSARSVSAPSSTRGR